MKFRQKSTIIIVNINDIEPMHQNLLPVCISLSSSSVFCITKYGVHVTSKTQEHLSIKELGRGVASYPGPLCDEGPGYEARGRGYGCIVCYMIWPQYLETTIMHCRPLQKKYDKDHKN